eukprot:SAG22_NODE_2492_length_2513_cov_9.855841_2_plen_241_part_00
MEAAAREGRPREGRGRRRVQRLRLRLLLRAAGAGRIPSGGGGGGGMAVPAGTVRRRQRAAGARGGRRGLRAGGAGRRRRLQQHQEAQQQHSSEQTTRNNCDEMGRIDKQQVWRPLLRRRDACGGGGGGPAGAAARGALAGPGGAPAPRPPTVPSADGWWAAFWLPCYYAFLGTRHERAGGRAGAGGGFAGRSVARVAVWVVLPVCVTRSTCCHARQRRSGLGLLHPMPCPRPILLLYTCS